jgi:hypothetical protein
MVNAKEFVETVIKMLYSECRKRGLYPDEDLVQDVVMWSWDALKRLYDKDRGVKLTTYLWKVVDTALKNAVARNRKEANIVFLEDMREQDEDGHTRDWYYEDTRRESFSSKLLRIVDKYSGLVGMDFLKLLIGEADVSNALRSVQVSKVKGEEWIQWWLGRQLTEVERRCCQEIRELLLE